MRKPLPVDPLRATHCPYCMREAELVKGDRIYKERPDLASQWFWLCEPCDAYVGCHRRNAHRGLNGKEPLGRLANKNLRRWRRKTHAAFDPLWREKGRFTSRSLAYAWLAGKLGIDKSVCHIAMFDESQCRQVIEACRELNEKEG